VILAAFSCFAATVAIGGEWLLDIWLGPDFAVQSAPVLTVIMLGVLLNSVAYVPYALLHGVIPAPR
jgi:O-antigen/teichoic acid export membrane protein